MTNSIGSFAFLSLRGAVDPPVERIDPQIVVRPGITGVGLWKTGRRGRPFGLRSAVDQSDLEAAHAELGKYRALIGEDPVALVQDDHDYAGDGFKVAVLAVARISIQKVLTPCGGLNLPSLAKLVCQWQLIAIENVEE